MPIYDYRCMKCGTRFEVRATFAEKEKGLTAIFPNCQDDHPDQVVTGGMFIRLGSNDSFRESSSSCGPGSGGGCCG